MRKSKIFLYFCLCFILGIFLHFIFEFEIFYAFIILLICLISSALFWQKKNIRILLLGSLFLFLGFLRFDISQPEINANHISFFNEQKIKFSGQIIAELDERETDVKLTLGNIKIKGNNIPGRILINASKYKTLAYGDWLEIECELKKPDVIVATDDFSRDFDYGKYLSAKNIYSVCYKTDSLKILEKNLNLIQKINKGIINSKQKFKTIIDKSLPLPFSGVLNAMLLGYKRELPTQITQQFSQTGISHIVAISGLHITLIAGIIFYLFIMLGVPRKKSFWPSISILLLYILMIGFRASAIRAFIMASILLYALKIGRLSKSLNILIFAGSILLMINPQLLLADIGFQLSFLAVLGIIYAYPILNKWLEFITDKYKIRSIICMTLSAQVLTLPLIIYYFGTLPIISPLSNLLILPILPVIILAGIILIILGLIWSKLAFVFGFLVWLILSYIIKIVELLSQIPYAFFKFKVIPFWSIGIIYFIIIIFYIKIKKKKNFVISTDL